MTIKTIVYVRIHGVDITMTKDFTLVVKFDKFD